MLYHINAEIIIILTGSDFCSHRSHNVLGYLTFGLVFLLYKNHQMLPNRLSSLWQLTTTIERKWHASRFNAICDVLIIATVTTSSVYHVGTCYHHVSALQMKKSSCVFKVGQQPPSIDNHNSMTLKFMISLLPQSVTDDPVWARIETLPQTNIQLFLQPRSYLKLNAFAVLSGDTRAAGPHRAHTHKLFLKFVQLPPRSVGLHT